MCADGFGGPVCGPGLDVRHPVDGGGRMPYLLRCSTLCQLLIIAVTWLMIYTLRVWCLHGAASATRYAMGL